MNANWERVQAIFHQAIDVLPDERASFLDTACAGDGEIRVEVESLLAHDSGGQEIAAAVRSAVQSLFDATPIKPGTRVGDYEILKLIGSGGMGEVYQAKDVRLHRNVAVKMLPAFLMDDPDRLWRFEQEARAAAALSHPNIVAVYQLGFYDGAPYLVSELLEGSTLREAMKGGPFPAHAVVTYGLQIVRGLAAMHGKGIVHRDLKPENVFVTNDGHVKILDFGLAKFSQPSNSGQNVPIAETGVVVGTAGYMSPEQVLGQDVDARSDFFAFGAILCEMLSGQRAFAKPSAADTMSAILNEDPPEILQFVPANPSALRATLQRCLEKDREQRFQSAPDLALALEELSNSSHQVLVARANHWRNPKRLSFAITLAICVLLGLAYQLRPMMPVPRVSRIEPLTNRGEALRDEPLFTDGPRLYYMSGGPMEADAKLRQVLTSGRQDTPSAIPGRFHVLGLSPDDSEFVAYDEGQSHVWRISVAGGSPHRVGDLVAEEIAWSHDGNSFAYARDNQLFLANADGTSSRALATLPKADTPVGTLRFPTMGSYAGTQVRQIRWSPDDRRIRFTFVGEAAQSLWEVGKDGGKLRELRFKWPGNPMECCGEWTPDGRYYVFRSSRDGISNLWALEEKPDWWHRPNPEPVQLTSGPVEFDEPLPSRDGKSIFAVGIQPFGELVRYDPRRKSFSPFLGGRSLAHLAFSPDGKWLAYVAYPDRTLWRSHPDGSEPLQLTFSSLGQVLCPRWSADSRQIAFFTRQPGRLWKDFLISADGGNPQPFPEEQFSQAVPDWMPGPDTLIYSRSPYANDPALYLFDRRSGHSEKIPGSNGLYGPIRSPDGRHISAVDTSTDQLILFDLNSKKRSPLTTTTSWPAWSPDSQYVYFVRGGVNWIFRVRVADGREEKYLELPFRLALWPFTVAPDGSLILLRERGNRDVYSLSFN
jgi:serine/threonine protein kinase/Tol biopolymer transport system component